LAAVLLAQAWAASAKEAPAVLEPALLLPEAAAPWRAVSDSAALWQPRFQGPDVVLRGSYRRGTDRVDLHVAYYAYQREGAEAVSELNDLAEVGRPWRVLRLKPAEITVNGRPHRFTRMLLTDRTDTYVVWYWYRVAGENARSRLFAKLLELKALMPGAEKSASVIAIASRVSEDAERTNALLAAFLEQTLDSNGSLVPDGGRWTGR
jgi:EpsI family protein